MAITGLQQPTLAPDVTIPLRRRARFVALALGAAGLVLSASGSWIPSLWGDEAASVLSAERSLPSLFRMLGHVDAVHGTYYLFLHFWIGLFGTSAFAVRLPSAIAIGLMVAGTVLLANRLGGVRMAWIAGVIALVIPRSTYMGEEARGYAMSAAAAVWLTLLLVDLVTNPTRRARWWVLYGIGVGASAYVFLFSLLLLVAHAAFVVSQRRPGLLKTWAKAAGIGLLLALPVIAYGAFERQQVAFLARRSDATFADVVTGQWFGGNVATSVAAWALIAAALAIPSVAHARTRLRSPGTRLIGRNSTRTPRHLLLISTWLLAPTVILIAVNAVHPIYSGRYLSFCVPAAALVMASVLTRIRRSWLVGILIACLAATSVVTYVQNRTPYAKNGSDWAAEASVIGSHAVSGDGVIFDQSTKPSQRPRLAMRTYPAAFTGLNDIQLKRPWYDTNTWHDSVYPLDRVTERLEGVQRIWVVEYRAPGAPADAYDLEELGDLGYSVTRSFTEHSSVIFEMEN